MVKELAEKLAPRKRAQLMKGRLFSRRGTFRGGPVVHGNNVQRVYAHRKAFLVHHDNRVPAHRNELRMRDGKRAAITQLERERLEAVAQPLHDELHVHGLLIPYRAGPVKAAPSGKTSLHCLGGMGNFPCDNHLHRRQEPVDRTRRPKWRTLLDQERE